jgi:hypothetical protein
LKESDFGAVKKERKKGEEGIREERRGNGKKYLEGERTFGWKCGRKKRRRMTGGEADRRSKSNGSKCGAALHF